MKYEITIKQLEEYTPEEEKDVYRSNRNNFTDSPQRFSSKNFHETRVLQAILTEEEYKSIKKAVIEIF